MTRPPPQTDPRPHLSGHLPEPPPACHPACFACRSKTAGGLGLRFQTEPDGALVAEFFCDPIYRSYPENVHGGHLALLLDAAMGHYLFQQNAIVVTGRLNIGFAEPVRIGQYACVRVAIPEREGELYRVHGEIMQAGRVCVRADGKFTIPA